MYVPSFGKIETKKFFCILTVVDIFRLFSAIYTYLPILLQVTNFLILFLIFYNHIIHRMTPRYKVHEILSLKDISEKGISIVVKKIHIM